MSYTNFVQLRLALAATSGQTSLTVVVPAAPFVLPAANGIITLLDVPSAPTKAEIVSYTTVTVNGDGTATLGGVVRGREGTTAQAWPAGAMLTQSLTAAGYAADLATKQNFIAPGTAAQFWRGDKTWADLGNAIRAAALSSYLPGSNAPLNNTDTVEGAFGKVQAQLDAKLPLSGGVLSGGLVTPSMNGGQLAGMRNKIIDGKMEITQRGVNFPAANGYTLDRWQVLIGGGGAVTASQQADVPPSNEFRTSLRVAVTTAGANIAASDYAIAIQKVEGYNARDLIGRTFTFSFWVRSSKTGVHCVAFRNETPDRSYVLEYTVNAANTWEYKTVTVFGGLITAGTWNWLNGTGLDVVFALAAGSNFRTAAGAWQTGNFVATANQVNCLDTTGNIFAVTGVQLEPGPVATPFEHRDIGTELSLCQRYYEVAFTAMYNNNGTSRAVNGANISFVPWKVSKRAAPTVGKQEAYLTNVYSAAPDLTGVNGVRMVVVQDSAGAMDYGTTIYGDAELR